MPMQHIFNDSSFKSRRKELRNHLGLPEIILWNQLKGSKLGVKFRRQNKEVLNNADGIILDIKKHLQGIPPPSASAEYSS
jgi:very-short-patch-repair endonuclease